jgi:Outer membrane protein beta-barrel domain
MKKVILLFVCILATQIIFAQSRVRIGFRFNPLISMARVLDKDKSSIDGLDKSGKFLFSTGVMAKYSFSETVGFYTGALVSLRGFTSEVTDINPQTEEEVQYFHKASLTYLEIPTALHLLSNEIAPGIKIRGLFGLTHNILFGANATRNKFFFDGGVLDNSTKERRSTKTYKLFVPNFLVGAGIEWELEGIGLFDLGISYHQSLGFATTKALRDNDSSGDRVRLNMLSFDLGYYF